jgi:hypothetical protein
MSSPIVINNTNSFYGKFIGKCFTISKVRYTNEEGIQMTVDVDKNNHNFISCAKRNTLTHITLEIKGKKYSFKKASANFYRMEMLEKNI